MYLSKWNDMEQATSLFFVVFFCSIKHKNNNELYAMILLIGFFHLSLSVHKRDKTMFFPCIFNHWISHLCCCVFFFVCKKKVVKFNDNNNQIDHVNACDRYQCSRCISFGFRFGYNKRQNHRLPLLFFIDKLVSAKHTDFASWNL